MRIKPRFNQLEEGLRQPTQVWLDPDTGKLKAGPKGGGGAGWAHLALGHTLSLMASDDRPYGNLYGCVWNQNWADDLLNKTTPGNLSAADLAALDTIAQCHQVVTTRRTLAGLPATAWQVFNYDLSNTSINPFWARNYRVTTAALTEPSTLSMSWMNGYASVPEGMPGIGIAAATIEFSSASMHIIPEPAAGVVVPVVDVNTGGLILPSQIHTQGTMGDFHTNGVTLSHFDTASGPFTKHDKFWVVGRLQVASGAADPLPDFAFDIWPQVVVVG